MRERSALKLKLEDNIRLLVPHLRLLHYVHTNKFSVELFGLFSLLAVNRKSLGVKF